MRHLKVKRPNVAHRLPRGKRAPGTEINHFQEQQTFRKQPYKKVFNNKKRKSIIALPSLLLHLSG
ncbi:hypothetical protein P8610_19225 [Fictibacillus sp. UD]|uniref:hypothetical protein n=1 Tax=Fictibacillus sp. UD TaxID=3038777 RepID=UPI003745AE1E